MRCSRITVVAFDTQPISIFVETAEHNTLDLDLDLTFSFATELSKFQGSGL